MEKSGEKHCFSGLILLKKILVLSTKREVFGNEVLKNCFKTKRVMWKDRKLEGRIVFVKITVKRDMCNHRSTKGSVIFFIVLE